MSNTETPIPNQNTATQVATQTAAQTATQVVTQVTTQMPAQAITEPDSQAATTNKSFVFWLSLIVFFSLAVYLTLSGNYPKFSRAEVFFAECAREMLAQNNFITPLYHGKPFFDKPILTYWLILASFKTFAVSHLVARIPSIMAAIGTVIATAFGVKVIYNARAGILAALMLASSFMFTSFACLCMSDMLLVLFDTLSLSLLYAASTSLRHRNLYFWLASISIGLAFATKGPVGLVLPVLSFLIYLTVTKQLNIIKLNHLFWGGISFITVASPWFIAAFQANGLSSMEYFFIRENLQRFAGSTYDTHKPITFMITSLFGGFAPWSVFLPFALIASIKKWREGLIWQRSRQELYLWLWVAVVIGFFSLSRGKIDYYALPAYPACAALCGMYLSRAIDNKLRSSKILSYLTSLILAGSGVASFFILPKLAGTTGSEQTLFWTMPLALILCGSLGFLAARKENPALSFGFVYIALSLSTISFSIELMPKLIKLQPVVAWCEPLSKASADTQIGVYKSSENWIDEITFQTKKEPVKLNSPEEIAGFIKNSQKAYIICPKDIYDSLTAQAQGQVTIADSKSYVKRSLNPGFALKNAGKLTAAAPLMLLQKSDIVTSR
jgi:4-amino-4-deoxy-L-arabinose transferase-like glycosyltransferase